MTMEIIMQENRSKRVLAACCGMDLCWLYAWASFMAVATTTIRFPLWAGFIAFFGALGTRSLFMIKRTRLIWHVLAHACGAGLLLRSSLYHVFGTISPQTIYQWYQVLFVVLAIGIFWYKGARLAGRALGYRVVCNHFDLGVSLLFAITCIKLFVELKAGIVFEESFTFNCIWAFFLFGLTALFLSFNETGKRGSFLKGFRTYGLLISVTTVLILVCIGSFLIFRSFMTRVAESGYTALVTASDVVNPYIKSLILFLFQRKGGV